MMQQTISDAKITRKLNKYIIKKNFQKLNSLISNNSDENTLRLFENERNFILYDTTFSTTLLYYCFAHDQYDLSRLLLSRGFNVYKGYDTFLMIKTLNSKKTNIKYLKLLIEYNFDVNHKCHIDHATILHMACIAANLEAVTYLLRIGAIAFDYKYYENFTGVNMNAIVFGTDNTLTPMSLVTELTCESAYKIALVLISSIPDLYALKYGEYNGFNKDIDELLIVSMRKNNFSIFNLLANMNFDFSLFEKRLEQIKYKLSTNELTNLLLTIGNFKKKRVFSLKEQCRLALRAYLGKLEHTCELYRPSNCYKNHECIPVPRKAQFFKRLTSLPLPVSLINYLSFDFNAC